MLTSPPFLFFLLVLGAGVRQVTRLGHGDRLKQLGRADPEPHREPHDIAEAGVQLRPFDPPDVISMDLAQLRQGLLGEAAGCPQLLDSFAEQYHQFAGHRRLGSSGTAVKSTPVPI